MQRSQLVKTKLLLVLVNTNNRYMYSKIQIADIANVFLYKSSCSDRNL